MTKILLPKNAFKLDADPPHIQRLKSIFKWRLPIEGTSEWVDFRLRSASALQSRAYRHALKEVGKKAYATFEVLAKNGAGLPADTGLREFCDEYNRRVARHGLHYLPASFNIFEAFFDYNPKYALFIPLKEEDHICSVAGFLDYIAEDAVNVDGFSKTDFEGLEQAIVYNFSFLNEIGEWIIGSDTEKFTIASVSMVRRGSEITLVSLAGKQADLAAGTIEINKSLEGIKKNPHKPDLVLDSKLKSEAVKLGEKGEFWKCYLGIRYNIDTCSIDSRYFISDNGSSWFIQSDDPLTLDGVKEISGKDDVSDYVAGVERYSEIFLFMIRLLKLKKFFSENKAIVITDKSLTELTELSGSLKGKKILEQAMVSQKIYERAVYTLRSVYPENSGVVLPPLELKVETEGFWERLPFGAYGEGPDGERVLGRTWVRRTLSSRQSTIASSANVFLSITSEQSLAAQSEGYIYVFRNASHQIDIFKIGLTRRSVSLRASEVSRGTGIPDQFLVVQYWWVPDVVYAEKRIHELLGEYRLRDAREFFRAEYITIRSTIDLVVGELSGRLIK